MVLSLTRQRAQPGAQPSKVLSPGTAAKGPFVGKAGAGGVSGLGGVVGTGGLAGVDVEVGVPGPGL